MILLDVGVSSSPQQLTQVIQSIGTLGVLVVIIWTGFKGLWEFRQVTTRFSELWQLRTEAERARADRAESEVARYRLAYEDKVLPMLDHSNQLLASSQDALTNMAENMERLTREISELKGRRS